MKKKISLNDLGRAVKPRILTEAFLLYNFDHIDLHSWWQQVRILERFSKSYKKDTIVSTYGKKLDLLFSDLMIENYIAIIKSFIVFHEGKYKLISTKEEVEQIKNQKNKYFIGAAGIEIYKTYDMETKEGLEPWPPTKENNITWFYKISHLIPIEDIEKYNTVIAGDLIVFSKTQGLVTTVKKLKRNKFYSTCSWTNKKITILGGNKALKIRLGINRQFDVIKNKSKDQSS